MRVVTDDGVGIEVSEAGRGPTLLLVHGFGGAKEDFADHVDALAATHHVVTFDHRGHGESDSPPDASDYTLDRMAADTLAVADAVGADHFRLLGHSMGGMIARRVVLAAPDRVEALVLMDTSPGPVPGIDGEILEMGAVIALNEGMDELKRIMDEFQPLGTSAYERTLVERPGYQEFNDKKWFTLSAVMWATMAREIRDQPDQLAQLAAVRCPTLVIVGEQDDPFLGVSQETADTIPGAEIVVIEDAGHSPQFENPTAWYEALARFLDGVQRASDAGVSDEVLGSGGRLAAEVLRRHDVDTVFTLSGGHLFPFFDGCVQTETRLIDVRHEQTATFAAEGWAKVTRRVGVCALTAGPGVTNGVSALTAAQLSGSPMLAIGGRAPAERWGSGSLQELDPVPILESVVKRAETAASTEAIPEVFDAALLAARTPHRGPTFVDVALDVFVNGTMAAIPDAPDPARLRGAEPDPDAIARVAKLVGDAAHPVVVAGGDVYWDRAEGPLRDWAEAARVPVFANGMGRGLLPADHELAFARARSVALKEADLVLVAGTPLDFRLGFGVFGDARVVHLCDAPDRVARHAPLAASTGGDLARTFAALADGVHGGAHDDWIDHLRGAERDRRAVDADAMGATTAPIKPQRIYGALRERLDRDAIVIGDGGDFVSYAGQLVDSYGPGCFLDPGPFGCLGMGPGYALAAGIAHPGRQLVLLLGDGAIGFALGDLDTLVRFGIDVVMIVGNNGIWGLEKHPMELFFGYAVAAELRPETRYDLVLEALGGHGELVQEPDQLGPALDRAFATKGPSLVNVITDPADAYPRSSNLA